MISHASRTSIVVVCLIMLAASTPVRRSPDLEARRRSAIDRSLIRFGRSYPAEPSAADIRDAFQRSSRRGSSFLRFGRSQTVNVPTEDLYTFLKNYEEYDTLPKRSASFIRFGRDPSFIRFGRSGSGEYKEQTSDLIASGAPQREARARDHFLRLGRDSEQINDEYEPETEERRKRSTESDCQDCQS